MDLKIGVIIIGSLLWENTEERINWRKNLDISKKQFIKLPIRYGRQSNQNRHGTYSMVFSNETNISTLIGQGVVIPFKNLISSKAEFNEVMLQLSEAEGISNQYICKSWGTVSIILNPFIIDEKRDQIDEYWTDLVTITKQSLNNSAREPRIEKFGEDSEVKSIDENWKLTLNLHKQFSTELNIFDALIATSNAVKLQEEINKYPTVKQIAKAIYDNQYFEYFLNNTANSIRTFQDRKIAKILKRKYKVSLKKINTASNTRYKQAGDLA